MKQWNTELDREICEHFGIRQVLVHCYVVVGGPLPVAYQHHPCCEQSERGTRMDFLAYPRVSSTWEGMGTLIAAVLKRGWWCVVKSPFEGGQPWHAGFTPLGTTGWNGRPDWKGSGDDAPMAVALAVKEMIAAGEL